MITTLENILSYQHPAVVRRFQKEYPEKAAQAETLFRDLLIFFWCSMKHQEDKRMYPENDDFNFIFIMDEEMRYIDFMWHVFLLYTKDYMHFCDQYFGEYLHHLPDIVPMLGDKLNPEVNLTKFLNYVFDNLGEEVVRRWFPLSAA